jgi:[acyl-carrier-protein] S-malonyltransferase
MKNCVMIFPGQGAQFVGMGKDFYNQFTLAKEIFDEADDRLSFYLSKLIFSGDPKDLALTKNSQVAIYVTSIAILRVIESEFTAIKPLICAGLSLGEYSALTASRKILFSDCLDLVHLRGLYMHQAAIDEPGIMAAVLGLEESEVINAIKDLPLWVANLNCQGQIVISGRKEAFESGVEKLKEIGAKRVIPLDVSGAFHTELMNSAKEKLEPRILSTTFHLNDVEIAMNVAGDFVSDIEKIKQNLILQVVKPVRWEASIYEIEKRTPSLYLEIGPGNTLAGMNRKNKVLAPTISIGKVEDLELLEGVCKT